MRSEPFITALMVTPILRAGREQGIDLSDLVDRLHLPSSPRFEDCIPFAKVLELWESAVRRGGDRGLPVAVVSYPPREEASPVGLAAALQDTVDGAARIAERYWETITNAYRLRVERTSRELRMVVDPCTSTSRLGWRCQIEFDMMDIVVSTMRISNGAARPRAVSFSHGRPRAVDPYEATLSVAPRFSADRTEIVYANETLALPLAMPKPALARRLEGQLDQLLERRRLQKGVLPDARAAVVALLRGGELRAEEVARRLGLGRRTLDRRLASEGTTFRALVDETRFDLAREWLAERDVADVAARLGYADTRAFDRAFRRWSGTTPTGWRRRRG